MVILISVKMAALKKNQQAERNWTTSMRDNDGILAWPVTNEILVLYDQFILPEGNRQKKNQHI